MWARKGMLARKDLKARLVPKVPRVRLVHKDLRDRKDHKGM
jgi:hypothetical protein